jgi:hypothetical protein
VQDGRWHMITLTTLKGSKGYSMYLDGMLVAQLNPSTGALLASRTRKAFDSDITSVREAALLREVRRSIHGGEFVKTPS